MDGCSRQDPAYRPATERPRPGGASLLLSPEPRGGTSQGSGPPAASMIAPMSPAASSVGSTPRCRSSSATADAPTRANCQVLSSAVARGMARPEDRSDGSGSGAIEKPLRAAVVSQALELPPHE